ncbi:MAG: phosphatidylserine decarboxylase [Campylobacteraceae bacterium 4484_166]|nr:MAG: phosphatidylserine decarboxylase [Campylobacteraceae bacterium 4484_166]
MKKHITNRISNIFDKFANKKFPKFIQNIINSSYVKLLALDMREFRPANSYETLNQLFTRELVEDRKFDQTNNTYISPADSFVSAQGEITKNISYQIKGMSYKLDELLTIDDDKLDGGRFMNFYLSPKDYHRYHSPYDFKLLKLIHITGKLYPVNFRYLNKKEDLFIQNERVVAVCETAKNQKFYMVFVGALNVGKMVFDVEPKIETNTQADGVFVYDYKNLQIKKGDCMGYFKMGSTILLFWQKDMIKIENLENKKVKFTDTVARSIYV